MYEQVQFINEFGDHGSEQLASLLCGCARTVLWTPVYSELKHAHEAGRTVLTPEGFIDLLADPEVPVQVMGREEWLTDKSFRRRHHWEPARSWNEDFDGVIARLALEDHRKPLRQRRVIISASEFGWELAESRLNKDDGEIVRKKLHNLFDSRALPPAILNRAMVNKEKGKDPALTILRDIFNHTIVIQECQVTGSALDRQYLDFWTNILDAGVTLEIPEARIPTPHESPTEEDEIFALLRMLEPLYDEKRLKKFMRSKERERLHTLLDSDRKLSLRLEVLHRLEDARDRRPYLMRILSIPANDPIGTTLTFSNLVVLLITLITSPRTIAWGWVPVIMGVLREELRRQSYIPASFDAKRSLTSPIFYLCYNSKRPTNKEINEIREILLRA